MTRLRKFTLVLLLSAFASLMGPPLDIADAQDFKALPINGMVTMIDLGAKKCFPCKMMAPILAVITIQKKSRPAFCLFSCLR